jgi:hypothetical protein
VEVKTRETTPPRQSVWEVHDYGPTKILVAGAGEAMRYLV